MEAFQKRRDMKKKILAEKNKVMSTLKIRKLLMRKVSLRFGDSGKNELIQKLVNDFVEKKREEEKKLEEVKETLNRYGLSGLWTNRKSKSSRKSRSLLRYKRSLKSHTLDESQQSKCGFRNNLIYQLPNKENL